MTARRALSAMILLCSGTGCHEAASSSTNETAIQSEQDRTMKEAVDDVDAATAAARPAMDEAAEINTIETN